MIREVSVEDAVGLDEYGSAANLAGAVRELRTEAERLTPSLRDRTVWMVNSTARGGGVAEMLPKVVRLLRELGVRARWVVIEPDRPEFFALTKRLHNLIHGEGEPGLGSADRELYESVNAACAEALASRFDGNDLLVVHDPQPMALGSILRRGRGVTAIWRCHIGLDEQTRQTRDAWEFLRPYADGYDHAVFSAPEYIPDFFAGRASIIHPALDPFGHKNRELTPHKLTGILCNSGLHVARHPVLTPPFPKSALRLSSGGSFVPALRTREIGLLYRPIVTQVSRWDRLKGFVPLLKGFVRLKERVRCSSKGDATRHRRRLEIVRLVLAGPDPASIQDDPEGQEVVRELVRVYRRLSTEDQADVAILTLPMDVRKENALMVNALQRCSTIVVQNSLREGFGLTATEAMWKRVPVLGTRACGLRQQIRDGIDGVLTREPRDPDEIATRIDAILADVPGRDLLARAAQRRVHEEFLVFTQIRRWLRLLARWGQT